jgi:hypothetical protein
MSYVMAVRLTSISVRGNSDSDSFPINRGMWLNNIQFG